MFAMIRDKQVIAFTPCGRKRYMDLLAAHVMREHNLGNIDKWVLFNNPYTLEDSTYADQMAAAFDWVEVLRVGEDTPTRGAFQIASFYGGLKDREAIYVRLDDDLIFLAENAIANLVNYRIDNPLPFLVYPTIINNTRTSFQLQKHGIIPQSWGIVEPILCAPTAWRDTSFVFNLHQMALASIDNGTLVEDFTLPSGTFNDFEEGNISINSFAIFGNDMVDCKVLNDEEGYLSKFRPAELGRFNARCGNAVVIHFAYHTQTEFMDKSGMLTDYAALVEPLPFRTKRLAPGPVIEPPATVILPPPSMQTDAQRRMLRQTAMRQGQFRPGPGLRA